MNGYEKEINSREEQKNRIRERYKGVDRSELEFIPAKPKEKLFEDTTEKRVCAYCRVSTDDVNQTSSYELQKNHYEDMIKEHQGWKLVGIYADEGISGTSLQHRDEFNRMIEDCKSGKIDLIVTKSVSRFARNIVDCIATPYRFIGNIVTYQTARTAITAASTNPNNAPTITQKAAIPTVPDKLHLVGIMINIYGIPTGIPYTNIKRNQSTQPSSIYMY